MSPDQDSFYLPRSDTETEEARGSRFSRTLKKGDAITFAGIRISLERFGKVTTENGRIYIPNIKIVAPPNHQVIRFVEGVPDPIYTYWKYNEGLGYTRVKIRDQSAILSIGPHALDVSQAPGGSITLDVYAPEPGIVPIVELAKPPQEPK